MLARKALAGTAGAPKEYVEDVFSTYLYTGNGSTQTITNGIDLSGEGGLVWIKNRNNTGQHHALTDTARGINNPIYTNLTNAQNTGGGQVSAFNANGFSLNGAGDENYASGYTYASWTFRKAEKFFDVVTYTGNGTAGRTISHNLGSVPGCIIVKNLTTAGTGWIVYHRSLGNTKILELNTTAAEQTQNEWNNTDPTSTVFSVYSGYGTNYNGNSYVAYLFAHDAGGFGSAGTDSIVYCSTYQGTGSDPGPTVTIGWQPQWLLIKRSSGGTGDWTLYDSVRDTTNSRSIVLYPNTNQAEEDTSPVDFLSTGFQPRTISTRINANGDNYVYIAIRKAD